MFIVGLLLILRLQEVRKFTCLITHCIGLTNMSYLLCRVIKFGLHSVKKTDLVGLRPTYGACS